MRASSECSYLMHVIAEGQKIQIGEFRGLVRLFSPILLMTFSNCIFLLIEKLLLARLSIVAMEAAVSAAYATLVFQIPCMAIAGMAQVCVGRWSGAGQLTQIGPGIWQFIWFSFLSLVITVPISIIYGEYYFRGTNVEAVVFPYYYLLTAFNFLYPLATTLSSFYIGIGKPSRLVAITLGSQALKLACAYLLIFGWGGSIPALGILGGAVSTVIVQLGFCLYLLSDFLRLKYAEQYASRFYAFRIKLFWECIHPGILRAFNRVLTTTCWSSTAHLMIAKGEDYNLILSLGGTLFLLLPFVGDAISQAQITVVSQLLGSRYYHFMDRARRSGVALVFIAIALFSIPFLFFPVEIFAYLFPTLVLSESVVRTVFFGIWCSFSLATFGYLYVSYILAFKDMNSMLFLGALSWVYGFLLTYIALEYVGIAADQFWFVVGLSQGINTLLYWWRMKWLQARYCDPFSVSFGSTG